MKPRAKTNEFLALEGRCLGLCRVCRVCVRRRSHRAVASSAIVLFSIFDVPCNLRTFLS